MGKSNATPWLYYRARIAHEEGTNMIPFPRMHIAESVLNRMQNAIDDTAPLFPSFTPAPVTPASPIALGQQIEEQTETPVQPVAMPEDPIAAGAAEESIFGGSPLAGAVAAQFES
jgi:hypothetical protein